MGQVLGCYKLGNQQSVVQNVSESPAVGNQPSVTQKISGTYAIAAGGNIGTIINGNSSASTDFPRAHTALYDSDCTGEKRKACLEGTRTDVLNEIYQWIDPSTASIQKEKPGKIRRSSVSPEEGSPNRPLIFWLTGLAGTGKSAIAQSVAEYCARRGWLAASFFFSRNDEERNSPKFVFSTIAHQLATAFHPPLMPLMQEAISAHPDIWHSAPSFQLDMLIVEPIRQLIKRGGSIPRPAVIVLDALDECKDDKATSSLASLISSSLSSLPFFILVTSRPERAIEKVLRSPTRQSRAHPFVVHEIKTSPIDDDIELFLTQSLADMQSEYETLLVPPPWLSEDNVRPLVRLSEGLFIFAATAVLFIGDPRARNPRAHLQTLLSPQTTQKRSKSTPYSYLDHLYLEILRHAFPTDTETETLDCLRMILGCTVFLRIPLSADSMSALLHHDVMEGPPVIEILNCLHSFLLVPVDPGVVRVMHASFLDFIVDPARCTEHDFLVEDAPLHHTRLFINCMNLLNTSLRRDICNIRNCTKLNSEIEGLEEKVEKHIPQALQYACRFWAEHLSEAQYSDEVLQYLRTFCFGSSLYWLEALSLIGRLHEAIPALRIAQQVMRKIADPPSEILGILYDLERFTLEFFSLISTAALHVYHSALPFSPLSSKIRLAFSKELDDRVKILGGIEQSWSPALYVIEGHAGAVRSVAFSPDGTRIVSGSADWTVRMWDASTGTALTVFKGHSAGVNAVAFSQVVPWIVSGSRDRTVRVWDVGTGTVLNVLKGHSFDVQSVAFSPDGTQIVSGSKDGIRVWNAIMGTAIAKLQGHEANAVAFSLDGTRIVSGSSRGMVSVWKASAGAEFEVQPLQLNPSTFSPDEARTVGGSDGNTGHVWDINTCAVFLSANFNANGIDAFAISLDGTQKVSSSPDHTVRVLDTSRGQILTAALKGHSAPVTTVALSPDGTRIVSGSYDRTIRVWDSNVNAVHSTLAGPRSHWIRSIAFSSDGTRIVCDADNNTLLVRNANTGKILIKLTPGHSGTVKAIAFSPDGVRIVSGSYDQTARVWDASTGAILTTFNAHLGCVNAVTFSPDGNQVVSGSADKFIFLWDASTGAVLAALDGHSDAVNAVAFSPDGTRIISGSWDGTVRVWDPNTAAILTTLQSNSVVYSVAFSADGTRIFSGSGDMRVNIWNARTGTILTTLMAYWDSVEAMATNGLYCSGDGWVFKYDNEIMTRLCWVPVSCRQAARSSRGSCLALGSDEGSVTIIRFPQAYAVTLLT